MPTVVMFQYAAAGDITPVCIRSAPGLIQRSLHPTARIAPATSVVRSSPTMQESARAAHSDARRKVVHVGKRLGQPSIRRAARSEIVAQTEQFRAGVADGNRHQRPLLSPASPAYRAFPCGTSTRLRQWAKCSIIASPLSPLRRRPGITHTPVSARWRQTVTS